MATRACSFVLLLGSLLGCADIATVGGVCLLDCTPPARSDAGTDSGSSDACAAPGCDAPGDASTPDAGPVCREGSYELSRLRTDLMLIVDDSASLAPWWAALNEGLIQFLQTTPPAGLAIGLQRFDEVCEPEPYINPLVPMAPLSENLPVLLGMLPFAGTLSTSTIPALDGVLQYSRVWAATHADSRVSVVLLTDASPGACDGLSGDYEGEAQRLARASNQSALSIQTYVVLLSVLQAGEMIARAGGTEVLPISVTPLGEEVRAALETVRQRAQACAFRWQPGWQLAPDSAVVITAPDGSSRRAAILPGSTACDQQDGFYVDDPTAAYPLLACPRTCAGLTATDRPALSSACSSRD